jgi:hypothetical protein
VKKGRFSEYEIGYIKQHHQAKSDSEIAHKLSRETTAITRKRKAMGFTKLSGRPTSEKREAYLLIKPESQRDREIYATLSSEQKREVFKEKFYGSQRFVQLLEVLTTTEVDFYSERYLDYMFTFETITDVEEDTLDLALKELIRSHRVLKRQKELREQLDQGGVIPPGTLEMFDRQYKDSVEVYEKLIKNLSGSRAQRIANNKEDTHNLVSVVQALQDDENRKKAGDEAALIEAAKNLVAEDMRKKHYLMD